MWRHTAAISRGYTAEVLSVQGTVEDAPWRERARAALTEHLRPYQQSDGIHLAATVLLAVASR